MPDQSHSLTGACLCGAVRYRYDGPLGGALGAVTLCHCRECRRAQGYGSAAAPALATGFTVVKGADAVREYESSQGKKRAFCGVCGSPLYSRRDAHPAAIRLRLGAIDETPPSLRIEAHIFAADAAPWSIIAGAPAYAGLEPERG